MVGDSLAFVHRLLTGKDRGEVFGLLPAVDECDEPPIPGSGQRRQERGNLGQEVGRSGRADQLDPNVVTLRGVLLGVDDSRLEPEQRCEEPVRRV